MKLNIELIAIFLIFFSCTQENQNSNLVFNIPNSSIELKGETFQSDSLLKPHLIKEIEGGIIVYDRLNESPIKIFDRNTLKFKRSLGVKGFGPGEIPDIRNINPLDEAGAFWVYSAMSKMHSKFNVNQKVDISETYYKQPEPLILAISMVSTSDSTYLVKMVDDKFRLIHVTKEGKRMNEFGSWDEIRVRPDMDNFNMHELYSGNLSFNSRSQIAVQYSIFVKHLDVINLKKGKIYSISSGKDELPKFDVVGPANNSRVVVDIDEPYTFRDVYVGEASFFVLYCGRNQAEINQHHFLPSMIFQFDFDGKLISSFNLDRPIRSFVVIKERNEIVGISMDEESTLVRYKLPS